MIIIWITAYYTQLLYIYSSLINIFFWLSNHIIIFFVAKLECSLYGNLKTQVRCIDIRISTVGFNFLVTFAVQNVTFGCVQRVN